MFARYVYVSLSLSSSTTFINFCFDAVIMSLILCWKITIDTTLSSEIESEVK